MLRARLRHRTPRPVAVVGRIAAPAEDVWAAMSAPGNLEACHPFCAENPVIEWPGPQSRDEVHYLSGWVFERRFVDWMEGTGYDLEIGRAGGPSSSVSWRITPIDDGACTLRIAVSPHRIELPFPIRGLAQVFYVRPRLRSYLEAVIGGFEWYVTRGEPVPRDHAGSHPWFSARSG